MAIFNKGGISPTSSSSSETTVISSGARIEGNFILLLCSMLMES